MEMSCTEDLQRNTKVGRYNPTPEVPSSSSRNLQDLQIRQKLSTAVILLSPVDVAHLQLLRYRWMFSFVVPAKF